VRKNEYECEVEWKICDPKEIHGYEDHIGAKYIINIQFVSKLHKWDFGIPINPTYEYKDLRKFCQDLHSGENHVRLLRFITVMLPEHATYTNRAVDMLYDHGTFTIVAYTGRVSIQSIIVSRENMIKMADIICENLPPEKN
jgi:hypothetical protein